MLRQSRNYREGKRKRTREGPGGGKHKKLGEEGRKKIIGRIFFGKEQPLVETIETLALVRLAQKGVYLL